MQAWRGSARGPWLATRTRVAVNGKRHDEPPEERTRRRRARLAPFGVERARSRPSRRRRRGGTPAYAERDDCFFYNCRYNDHVRYAYRPRQLPALNADGRAQSPPPPECN